jgi:hypothetical protein
VARPSHERKVVKTFAHHPLEVVTQISINGKNIISTLMVGNKNVSTISVDEVAVFNFHSHPKEEAHGPTPPLCRIVSPVVAVESTPNDGDYASDNGDYQYYRCRYAVVIYSVKDVHANVIGVLNYKDSKSFQILKIRFHKSIFLKMNSIKKFTRHKIVSHELINLKLIIQN